MRLLAWIGRQRTRAVAALIIFGMAFPPLGNIFRPYLTEAVIALLCIAFMRIDFDAFQSYFRRPWLIILSALWTSLAIPLLFISICMIGGIDALSPALFLALTLQAVTSPVMSAPAFAALMGLDATLVLAVLIVSSAITPFSAPLIASAAGVELSLSMLSLGIKLFGILAGSALLGLLVRRIAGAEAIAKNRDEIDGVNIIILFIFLCAIMGNLGYRLLTDPVQMALLTLLAFVVFFLVLAVTYCVFAAAGRQSALALGLMMSQRNMGLMLAATGGMVPDLTWIYFAVGQFPIYLSPMLFQPIARRFNAAAAKLKPGE